MSEQEKFELIGRAIVWAEEEYDSFQINLIQDGFGEEIEDIVKYYESNKLNHD